MFLEDLFVGEEYRSKDTLGSNNRSVRSFLVFNYPDKGYGTALIKQIAKVSGAFLLDGWLKLES